MASVPIKAATVPIEAANVPIEEAYVPIEAANVPLEAAKSNPYLPTGLTEVALDMEATDRPDHIQHFKLEISDIENEQKIARKEV